MPDKRAITPSIGRTVISSFRRLAVGGLLAASAAWFAPGCTDNKGNGHFMQPDHDASSSGAAGAGGDMGGGGAGGDNSGGATGGSGGDGTGSGGTSAGGSGGATGGSGAGTGGSGTSDAAVD